MYKTISAALIVLMASAPMAFAHSADIGFIQQGNSYISNFVEHQNDANQVRLGTVRADGSGVVEIHSYHEGKVGPLIGSEAVHRGANSNVQINIQDRGQDAIALLKVHGKLVDTQKLEFSSFA